MQQCRMIMQQSACWHCLLTYCHQRQLFAVQQNANNVRAFCNLSIWSALAVMVTPRPAENYGVVRLSYQIVVVRGPQTMTSVSDDERWLSN